MSDERAEKALIKAMGEKPNRLNPGSVEITGRNVSWEETCRSSINRGGDKCLHARFSIAPLDALDAFFEATEPDLAEPVWASGDA